MTPKMFTRRNWLLRCSILINVAVILYICSHVMIGGGGNFATGSGFIIQESNSNNNNNINNNNNNRIVSPSALTGGGGAGGAVNGPPSVPVSIKFTDESAVKTRDADAKQIEAQNQSQQGTQNAVANENAKDENANVNANADQPCEDGICNVPQPVAEDLQQKAKELSNKADEKQSIDLSDTPTDGAGVGVVPAESVTFVNNSNPDGYMATGDEKDFDERLRSVVKCHDRLYAPETLQRGDFWVLKNYVRAEHGELKCHETVTYTTHADFTFLDNLIPLLERWIAPISIALHAPGTDFTPTLNAIKYLRDCLPESILVRQYVTFHIYFSTKHIPKVIPKYDVVLNTPYNCSRPAPYSNFTSSQLYKTQKKLLYPVNVGRNVARDSALSHFILASDIELYPNPGLVKKFLEMIARNEAYLHRKAPRVFPLSIFEVEHSAPVPKDKTELQELLRTAKAIPFHKRVCSSCHGVPKSKEWMAANETEELSVFHIGKRIGYFIHWEPIYIGTHADPHYDERLSWEGKSDKMTQGYTLCVLDYEFHILDNAFLVHKPGIKVLKKDPRRAMLASKTNQLIRKIIYPELKIMYGTRKGCAV